MYYIHCKLDNVCICCSSSSSFETKHSLHGGGFRKWVNQEVGGKCYRRGSCQDNGETLDHYHFGAFFDRVRGRTATFLSSLYLQFSRSGTQTNVYITITRPRIDSFLNTLATYGNLMFGFGTTWIYRTTSVYSPGQKAGHHCTVILKAMSRNITVSMQARYYCRKSNALSVQINVRAL